MNRRILSVLLLFGLLFALVGCLFGPTVVTEADQGSLIRLNVGDRLLVRLVGTPSTGFSWVRVHPGQLTSEPLEPVVEGTCTISDQCGAVGRPGTYEFQYRAVHAGTVTLSFAYQRPWEDEPADRFSVVVWVR